MSGKDEPVRGEDSARAEDKTPPTRPPERPLRVIGKPGAAIDARAKVRGETQVRRRPLPAAHALR